MTPIKEESCNLPISGGLEIEGEGNYASSVFWQSTDPQTDQGLTLPPKIRSSDQPPFDASCSLSNQQFDDFIRELEQPLLFEEQELLNDNFIHMLLENEDQQVAQDVVSFSELADLEIQSIRDSAQTPAGVESFPAFSIGDKARQSVSSPVPCESPLDSGYGPSIADWNHHEETMEPGYEIDMGQPCELLSHAITPPKIDFAEAAAGVSVSAGDDAQPIIVLPMISETPMANQAQDCLPGSSNEKRVEASCECSRLQELAVRPILHDCPPENLNLPAEPGLNKKPSSSSVGGILRVHDPLNMGKVAEHANGVRRELMRQESHETLCAKPTADCGHSISNAGKTVSTSDLSSKTKNVAGPSAMQACLDSFDVMPETEDSERPVYNQGGRSGIENLSTKAGNAKRDASRALTNAQPLPGSALSSRSTASNHRPEPSCLNCNCASLTCDEGELERSASIRQINATEIPLLSGNLSSGVAPEGVLRQPTSEIVSWDPDAPVPSIEKVLPALKIQPPRKRLPYYMSGRIRGDGKQKQKLSKRETLELGAKLAMINNDSCVTRPGVGSAVTEGHKFVDITSEPKSSTSTRLKRNPHREHQQFAIFSSDASAPRKASKALTDSSRSLSVPNRSDSHPATYTMTPRRQVLDETFVITTASLDECRRLSNENEELNTKVDHLTRTVVFLKNAREYVPLPRRTGTNEGAPSSFDRPPKQVLQPVFQQDEDSVSLKSYQGRNYTGDPSLQGGSTQEPVKNEEPCVEIRSMTNDSTTSIGKYPLAANTSGPPSTQPVILPLLSTSSFSNVKWVCLINQKDGTRCNAINDCYGPAIRPDGLFRLRQKCSKCHCANYLNLTRRWMHLVPLTTPPLLAKISREHRSTSATSPSPDPTLGSQSLLPIPGSSSIGSVPYVRPRMEPRGAAIGALTLPSLAIPATISIPAKRPSPTLAENTELAAKRTRLENLFGESDDVDWSMECHFRNEE